MAFDATKISWITKLNNSFNDLMNRLEMPGDLADEIRGFMMQIAREQYKAGNNSGIRWARMNPGGSAQTT
jgi:hypothetical protein